jgi:hypothetical protein
MSVATSMDDERMLHPLRALAPDLNELRLADKPNDGLALAIAANEPPWRVDEAMNPPTGWKKTFGLVGRQSEFGVRHRNSPVAVCPLFKQTYVPSEADIPSVEPR